MAKEWTQDGLVASKYPDYRPASYDAGYRAGLEDAAKVCEGRAREIGEGSIGFTDVCVVIHRIRALADK